MDPDFAVIEEQEEDSAEREIDEQYSTWKKNAPYLYDIILSHALEWPSLSVQWLPGCSIGANRDFTEQKMYLTTHTSEGEQNYIMQVTIQMPLPGATIDMRRADHDQNDEAGFPGMIAHVTETVRINHDGEINRARYMPQNPLMLATKAINGDVNIFDIGKHPSVPRDSACHPDLILKGHTKEGYGLSWSTLQEGFIASGSDDKKLCVWNILEPRDSHSLQPIRVYSEHRDVIEDVAWHPKEHNLLASCGDDRYVFFYDVREAASVQHFKAHSNEVNGISFNPFQQYLFATASSDSTVALWDHRNLSRPLHSLQGHSAEVYSVAWSPFSSSILASAGVDRHVNIWDISRITREISDEEQTDGPAELVFVHAGHTAKVNDISWNLDSEWTMASVGDDNVLQVWQPNEAIYNEKYGDYLDLNSL